MEPTRNPWDIIDGMSGFTKNRLERMHRVLSGYVERGDLPGLTALVARDDHVHIETIGTLAVGETAPMRRDTIFRVASIAKPVTAVAAMILLEECKLRLDDSIEPWLPELANRRVLKSLASEIEDTVPAHRAVTVRDLLTSRMGFGSVMAMPDTYPIQRSIRDLQIGGDGPPLPGRLPSEAVWLERFASLPLIAQPGQRWMYHTSVDVLGLLIARVCGKSLGTFMRERIFEPLGMRDTGFFVPTEKLDRFATSYRFDRESNELAVFDGVADSAWHGQPPAESGGGGLVSTLDDYFAFAGMMLARGAFGSEQILSRASVELMTSDHNTPEQRAGMEIFFGAHSSWAFGMAVNIARDEIYRTPGRFGWDGGLGTTAYVDPAERTIGILFTQRAMDSPEPPAIFSDFWTLAYEAIA
jgi:CubicO group peptidase (beta-lactamase class C family)